MPRLTRPEPQSGSGSTGPRVLSSPGKGTIETKDGWLIPVWATHSRTVFGRKEYWVGPAAVGVKGDPIWRREGQINWTKEPRP